PERGGGRPQPQLPAPARPSSATLAWRRDDDARQGYVSRGASAVRAGNRRARCPAARPSDAREREPAFVHGHAHPRARARSRVVHDLPTPLRGLSTRPNAGPIPASRESALRRVHRRARRPPASRPRDVGDLRGGVSVARESAATRPCAVVVLALQPARSEAVDRQRSARRARLLRGRTGRTASLPCAARRGLRSAPGRHPNGFLRSGDPDGGFFFTGGFVAGRSSGGGGGVVSRRGATSVATFLVFRGRFLASGRSTERATSALGRISRRCGSRPGATISISNASSA